MPEKIPVSVLTDGITDLTLVETWGKHLATTTGDKKKVSTSQLRRFFGSIKQIQAGFEKSKGEIILLEPKLAYAVGRDSKNGVNTTKIKEFYDLMSPLIRAVKEDRARFRNFVNVFESIVAYHKAAGGE